MFRIQDNESVMCERHCIAFIEYMLGGKSLLDYIFFSSNSYKNNEKIMYNYFQEKYVRGSNS